MPCFREWANFRERNPCENFARVLSQSPRVAYYYSFEDFFPSSHNTAQLTVNAFPFNMPPFKFLQYKHDTVLQCKTGLLIHDLHPEREPQRLLYCKTLHSENSPVTSSTVGHHLSKHVGYLSTSADHVIVPDTRPAAA